VALRIFVAGLVAAVAVGGAVWLHGYREYGPITTVSYGDGVSYTGQSAIVSAGSTSVHPSWADPLAAGIVVAALGFGAAIVVPRFARPSY